MALLKNMLFFKQADFYFLPYKKSHAGQVQNLRTTNLSCLLRKTARNKPGECTIC